MNISSPAESSTLAVTAPTPQFFDEAVILHFVPSDLRAMAPRRFAVEIVDHQYMVLLVCQMHHVPHVLPRDIDIVPPVNDDHIALVQLLCRIHTIPVIRHHRGGVSPENTESA